MVRIFAVSFILITTLVHSYGQTWTRMQSWGLDFESVSWISDLEGIAVGERIILKTQDGGITWKEVLFEFEETLFDVVSVDENRCVAVGQNGIVYLSENKGESWLKKNSTIVEDLFSVSRFNQNSLVAVGKNGKMVVSVDFGLTWTSKASGTSANLNDVFFVNELTGFVVGDQGTILKTLDSGNTWVKLPITSVTQWNGVTFTSPLIGYVVGDEGSMMKTVNGGESWEVLNSGFTKNLRKVAFSPLDVRVIVAVGDSAAVVRTANSGLTFARPSLGVTNFRHLKNLGFRPGTGNVLSLGQDGYIITSANSGTSWTQRLAGIRNDFKVTDFKTNLYGFFAGNRGSVFVTSNGAQTLVNRSLPEELEILGMEFWNNTYGFVTGKSGGIYRTGNAGTAWVKLSPNTANAVRGLHIFLPEVPYVVGENGLVARTFSSGDQWEIIQNTNSTVNFNDLSAFDLQTAFAVGDKGQISWSNNGVSWETISSGTTQNLNFATRLDTATAIAVGNKGIILKTTDKARTWRTVASGVQSNLLSVDFFNAEFGFIVGEGGMVLLTKDGGETWVQINSTTKRDLNSVSAGGPFIAYAAGDDGTILKYECQPPVGSLSGITGSSASCLNNEIYSISEGPIAGSDLVWRIDGGEILSGQGTGTIEVKWNKTGKNGVFVSRTNFCGAGETSFLEVNIADLPTSQFQINGEGSVCQGNTYSYQLPNVEGISYLWMVTGGEILEGQGTSKISVRWNLEGQQMLTVTPENRCGKASTILKVIAITPNPNQPSVISGEPKVGLGEQFYETNFVAGLNYRWTISNSGGRILEGQGTHRIKVIWEKEGNFELNVDAQNQCGFGPKRLLPVNVNIITSLEPVAQNQGVKVYPNPSSGNLTIELGAPSGWNTLKVVNSLGKELRQLSIDPNQSFIDLDNLPKGLLFLRLSNSKSMQVVKVLVH
jgi:photosystem II stability/assembly factor-like uncharacterized protein